MKIFSPTISGSSQASGSLTISGSLNVSQGITGSLLGTASWAINVVNGGGGGSVGTLAQVTALGASTTIPITASIISASSFTGSLFGTSSWTLSASNAINARTASFLPVGTYSITSSWATNALTASLAPGYLLVSQTSSFVQNSQTSSFITNTQTSSMLAPYVLTSVTSSMLAPYILNSQTSSFVRNSQTSSMSVLSSSFATTASHALNGGVTSIIAGPGISVSSATGNITITNTGGGGGATFPYTGSAIISGSLIVTGSTNSSGGFTGSLFGTASHAITASYALSSAGGGGGTSTPYCLGIFGGRYDWSSGDNNERVLHGFVNGPTAGATANSEEFGTTIVGTIDVTTGSLNRYLLQYVGLYSPVGGIPNIKAWGRTSDADLTSAMSMSVSLWSTNEPANGFGTSTLTLRAQTPFLPFNAGTVDYIGNGWIASGSSERPTGSFYVVTFDLAGTITTTIQFYANFTIWID